MIKVKVIMCFINELESEIRHWLNINKVEEIINMTTTKFDLTILHVIYYK